MAHTLLAFHGFTQNAELMQSALGPLVADLEPKVRVVCLNAPHVRPETSARGASNPEVALGPRLGWWDASDDGLEYRGWEETYDVVREALDRYAPASILGFSQGAILAAAVAALSKTDEFPPIHCAVLVAGRTPRAARLQAAFMDPIAVPSLHVWGERDRVTGPFCQELADHFSETEREVVTWEGGHVIPTRGEPYDAMLRFVLEHA